MSDNRSDIDIADPNFWQKWAKKADLDLDEFGSKVPRVNDSTYQIHPAAQFCFVCHGKS